jgi:Fe-S cluster biogenesis protein NfuA
LHPDDLETRVQHALSKPRADAELIGVFEGVVRVRLTGHACGLKESVEAMLRDAVPDALDIVVEESAPSNGFVPLASLGAVVSRIA